MIIYPIIANNINIKELGNNYYGKNKWYIGLVPLNLIDFNKYDEWKYEHNKTLILTTKSIIPIMLGDYDNFKNKYTLSDGNHRCYCSYDIGYTYIPAIIPIKTIHIEIIKLIN